MKSLLKKLDSALGSIYAIDTSLAVTDFVLTPQPVRETGALLVKSQASSSGETDIEVGIVFHPQVAEHLNTVDPTNLPYWTASQTQAFAVAAEEVSHFRYFVFHAEKDRAVSQLELEFQGEIDKFLLFFFLTISKSAEPEDAFDKLFSGLFEQFKLVEGLTPEQTERYWEANQLAREFIQKHRPQFRSPQAMTVLLRELRALYRMTSDEKFSLRHRL